MLRQEAGQTRYDVQAPESHGRVNAQAARQSCGCATRGELYSIRFLNGSFGALIKIPTRLSRPQSASRAKQQSHDRSPTEPGKSRTKYPPPRRYSKRYLEMLG